MKPLEKELEKILHLNGCQQRTAGYNEAKDGKELDMVDTERLEDLTLEEVMTAVKKDFAKQLIDEVELAKESVARTREVYLTTDTNGPDGFDPNADYAIKVRDKLRAEIIEELDQRITKLKRLTV